MTATTDYITLDDLKAALRITTDTFDAQLAEAISAASWKIDQYCDDHFWLSDPTAKLFKADEPFALDVGSFASIDDTTIEFDQDDDGVFDLTLQLTDWQAEPTNRQPWRPYQRIQLVSSLRFPGARWYGFGYVPEWPGIYGSDSWFWLNRRARIRVTARWGWPQVPPAVRQACLILAIANYKSKDLTGSAGGSHELDGGKAGRVYPADMHPEACHLLHGLRRLVVA